MVKASRHTFGKGAGAVQRWEIAMMLVGIALLAGSVLILGFPVLNFVGVAMVLVPPVLFLVRQVEVFWTRSTQG